jgi:diguanylate cyclase (GGDEF)-like protein/PAS domain S-box-containing protein
MNISEVAYFTPFSNAVLSAVLLLLGTVLREERHAFYWGLGHLARSATGLMWLWVLSGVNFPGARLILIPLVALSVSMYVKGTLFFLRRFDAMARTWQLFLLVCVLLYGTYLFDVRTCEILSVATYGCLHMWVGYQLMRPKGRFRVIGGLQFLSGMLAILAASRLTAFKGLSFVHVVTFILYSATILGMIYVVIMELKERFPNAARNISDALWIHDERGQVVFANIACARMFGYEQVDQIVGRTVSDFLPFLTGERLTRACKRLADTSESFPLRFEFESTDIHGRTFPTEALVSPYSQGSYVYAMAQMREISDRKQHEEALHRAAHLDVVTSLPNRYALNERLNTLVGGHGEVHALLFLDLDHFKRINDSLSHVLGDQLLRAIGQRLSQVVEGRGLVARFGGDEFVVLLDCSDAVMAQAEAFDLAQQLSHDIRQPYLLDDMTISMTISVGMALYPSQAADGLTLLRYADSAMYASKRAGRNQIRLFDPVLEASVRESLSLDNELKHALADREFHLVYQPILCAEDESLSKVEALLRWVSPKLGFVSPDRFIPVAEESGLIVPLGTWVLQEACRQLGEWKRVAWGSTDLIMSVNVSAAQLASSDFIDLVQAALQGNSLQPHELELELTERTLIEEDPAVGEALRALRDMGVKLALDDFGTGYSSLNYLNRFQLDTLKMDRSFISELETDARCQELARHIIAMGQALGLRLVAEGVETIEQAAKLRQFGCDYLQGYLFDKPLKADDVQGRYLSQAVVMPQ